MSICLNLSIPTTNVIKLLGCSAVTSVPTGIRPICKSDLAVGVFIFRSVYLAVPYTYYIHRTYVREVYDMKLSCDIKHRYIGNNNNNNLFIESLQETLNPAPRYLALRDTILHSDSGEGPTGLTDSNTGGVEPQVNMEFSSMVDNHDATVSQTVDSLRQLDLQDTTTDLPTFLCRPIRIATVNWQVGDFLRETYDPWSLLVQNPAIGRKLANYAYLRAKLRVRATINGNGFYYGKALLAYNPLSFGQRDPERTPGNAPTVDNLRYSQRPHIVLDPCESRGGDLEVPYVNYFTYSAIQDASLANEHIRQLGRLNLSSFNKLAHANASTTPVTITLFAWFDDAQVVAPTQSLPSVSLASSLTAKQQVAAGTLKINEPVDKPRSLFSDAGEDDEYGEGVVSRPASAVARAAGALKSVPYIGRYATATERGANMVGNIAKLFGYNRPTNVTPINSFRPQYFGNLANTSITDASQKLTFDPKQELAIDPGATGYGGGDDMTISAISSTESYFTRANWDKSMISDTLIFQTAVSPSVISWVQGDLNEEVHTTPIFHCSAPFQYWRGSITYRFSVACSNFHRGRLRVVYDPVDNLTPSSPPDFSTTYQRVVDISDTKDFEITIPWNQTAAFREIDHYIAYNPLLKYTPTPDTTGNFTIGPILDDPAYQNGYLSIYVLNELTVPNDSDPNDPEINCFVRAGEDFELACPTSRTIEKYSFFRKDGGDFALNPPAKLGPLPTVPELQSDSGRADAQAGEGVMVLDTPGTVRHLDHTNLVYFGETIKSFRDLLKRYQFLDVFFDRGAVFRAKYLWRLRQPNFPLYRGYDSAGQDLRDGESYTYAKMTLMNWLTPSYVCRKGGIRWKYYFLDEEDYPTHKLMSATRWVPPLGAAYPSNERIDLTSRPTFAKDLYVPNVLSAWEGMIATATMINPTVEFELPYYSNYRFKPGAGVSLINFLDEMHETNVIGPAPSADEGNGVSRYVAAGEDFSLDWYLSAPVLYYDDDLNLTTI